MPNYRVEYAFEHSDSEARPEHERYGFGVIVVNTDKEPETPDELKDIARFIGTMREGTKTEDYKAVGILKIEETDLTIDSDKISLLREHGVDVKDISEVLEGEIVDE